jgi:hypothetical protein
MSIASQIPMFVLAAAVGAVVGCLVSIGIIRRALPSIMPTAQEQLHVDRIKMICNINARDGRTLMTGGFSTDYQELSAILVEQWLEKRGLVMMPKASDFTVKAPQ